MALRFDMGNSKWRELAAMQQQQSMSNLGQDIGGALAAGLGHAESHWSPAGKAYQSYLTDPENFDQKEFDTINGKKVKNPNYGKWKGPMKTFSQFRGDFRHAKKSDRLKDRFNLRPEGYLSGGKYTDIDEDYFKILKDKYEDAAVKKHGTVVNLGPEHFTEEQRKGAYYDWIKTDEAQDILKGHRKERRGEFIGNIGQFGQSLLPTPGNISRRIETKKLLDEMQQAGGATKTGGILGFLQRTLPGGKFGYTATNLTPITLPSGQQYGAGVGVRI
tara:strand:- start:3012 stop:3833 length:822 start_codon:yes stop_codon:yes gene_type:complete